MHATYLIIYRSENIELHLRLDATIETLRKEILKKTGLPPSQQDLFDLDDVDNNELLSDVCPPDNIIWLASKKGKHNDKQTARQEPSVNAEETARLHFVQLFTLKYGRDHINFQSCSLKQAITNCYLHSRSSGKLLLLYFHNTNDKLSQIICSGFAGGKMRTILEKSYNVLAWDLSTNVNGMLEDVLDEWVELKLLKQWLLTQKSALFIIYPFKESLVVYNIMHGDKLTLNQICQQLKKADDAFQKNLIETKELIQLEKIKRQSNDIGSKEFHQIMFDRLGDRDYDSFEPDQHTYLKDKIGFAKFGPPQTESGYHDAQNKSIDKTYKILVNSSNLFAKWKNRVVVSFIYNCLEPLPQQKLKRAKQFFDYNPYMDINPIPIFVIRTCKGSEHPCRKFVDSDNRVYSSWDDYITNNKLDKLTMILPKHGRYFGDRNGRVLLETHATPSCSILHILLQHADTASSVVGIASGAVLLTAAIPAITVAPLVISAAIVTGVGAGLYSIARTGYNIYDRVTHGESMSFTNSQARGAYLNIVAGTLGFVGVGATGAMTRLATQGVQIGKGARVAVSLVNLANTTLGAAAVAKAAYEMFADTWRENGTMSTLSLLQLRSSVLFFGNSVYNFRTVNDIQTNALRNHQESLQNNRHRKTFNKLSKETIRQNNGKYGRTDVISTISLMPKRNDIISVLTRKNKRFDKIGISFTLKNGGITLNEISVDLMYVDDMLTSQYLINLRRNPNDGASYQTSALSKTTNICKNLAETSTSTKYASLMYYNKVFLLNASKIMFNYSEEMQTSVLKILLLLLEQFDLHKIKIIDLFTEFFSNENPFVFCLNFTIEFLKIKISEHEQRHQTDNYYCTLSNLNIAERTRFWFGKVIDSFINDQVEQMQLKMLLEFIVTKLASKICNYYQKQRVLGRRMATTTTPVTKKSCKTCGGYYYVPIIK
ncbi:hypothetical protein FQR65_LT03612 [Abscondita terminalis]|nr:hypothetical protein FQR65_LT03612 [Abscondita terminalis]